jgi:hypothetical protein
MPYEYYSDEQHLAAWLEAEKDEVTLQAFVEKYICGAHTFAEYLALCGGEERMCELCELEPLKRCGAEA